MLVLVTTLKGNFGTKQYQQPPNWITSWSDKWEENLPTICFSRNTQKYRKYLRIFGEIAVVTNHERKSTRTRIEQRGKTVMLVGYADDHTGDVYRFIHLKPQHVIVSRDARWMNIVWRAYMRKQQCINQGQQIIDEHFESDAEIQENSTNQQPEHREEVSPLDQQRRLGLDIDMIGAREENLGSTRSQT